MNEIIRKKGGNHEIVGTKETRIEPRKLKRTMGKRKKKKEQQFRGLKKKERSIKETAEMFLKEFDVKEGVKRMQIVGREGREVVIVEMDSWERKEEIMRRKRNLETRRICIDHDMTEEARDVQKKLRERVREEKMEEKKVKVRYRKIEMTGKEVCMA